MSTLKKIKKILFYSIKWSVLIFDGFITIFCLYELLFTSHYSQPTGKGAMWIFHNHEYYQAGMRFYLCLSIIALILTALVKKENKIIWILFIYKLITSLVFIKMTYTWGIDNPPTWILDVF
ncbi:MAG: hypothetical protein R3Y51_07435 [Rikenellaceae bacterium]